MGLRLYIASEIAGADGGTIEVTSSPQETRFTFRMAL
jgi:signal transduction histidine kinase